MPLPGTAEVQDLCVVCHDRQIVMSQVTLADDFEKYEVRLGHRCKRCKTHHSLGWQPTVLHLYVRASATKKIGMTDKQTCHNGASTNSRDGAWQSTVNSIVRETTDQEEDRAEIAGYVTRGMECNSFQMYMPLWVRGIYLTLKVLLLWYIDAFRLYERLIVSLYGNTKECAELAIGKADTCHEVFVIWEFIVILYCLWFSYIAFDYVMLPHNFVKVVQLERNNYYKREKPLPPITFMPDFNSFEIVKLYRWVRSKVASLDCSPDVSSTKVDASGLTTPLLGSQPDLESGLSRDDYADKERRPASPSHVNSGVNVDGHTRPLDGVGCIVPTGCFNPSMDVSTNTDSNIPESDPQDQATGDGVPGSGSSGDTVSAEPESDFSRYKTKLEKEKAKKRPAPDAPERSLEFDCIRSDSNIALCHDPGVVVGGAAIVGGTYMTPALHESTAAKVEEAIDNRGYDNGKYVAPKVLKDHIASDLHYCAKGLCAVDEVPGPEVNGKKKMEWQPKKFKGKYVDGPFSAPRIRAARDFIVDIMDFKASKWTENRFEDCWFEALVKHMPDAPVAQIKQEVYKMKANGESKPPRLIHNCGGPNQVRSLFLITIFEKLLWDHSPYEVLRDGEKTTFVTLPDNTPPNMRGHFTTHIKGAPKQAACLKVRDAFRKTWLEPGERSYYVEGDGKNWDFTIRSTIMDALENKIFKWIVSVLKNDETPGIDMAMVDMETREKKYLKLVFKQHPSDKAKGAENIVFHINNCRRSGDRATSSANYLVNKVFWTLAFFPKHEAKKLLCHKYQDGSFVMNARNRWGQIQYWNLFCEGDDMLGNMRISNDTDHLQQVREKAVKKYFDDAGFLMEIKVAEEGDKQPVTYAGITYSNHLPPKEVLNKGGKTRYISQFGTVYAPQLSRMLQKAGVTTAAEGVAAARAGDVSRMQAAEAHKYIAWAVNCEHFPQLAIKWLDKADSVMLSSDYLQPLDREHHFMVYGAKVDDPETLGALSHRIRDKTGAADVCTEATRWAHVGCHVEQLDYVHFTTMSPDAGSHEMRLAAAPLL